MTIAIIAAMNEEVELLKNSMVNRQIQTYCGFEFYIGDISGCHTVLLKSGIGKVAAATGTAVLFNHYQVDAVINTGSAGGLDSQLKVGDIVISHDVFYHDVDLTIFGYQAGQMAGCPVTFKADESYRQLAKTCITQHHIHAVEGAIGSGDSFIHSHEKVEQLKQQFPDIVAVEMEAAAIAHVCWLYQKPFVVVRAISDNGDNESAMSFDEFLPLAAKQSSLIVETMLRQLAKKYI